MLLAIDPGIPHINCLLGFFEGHPLEQTRTGFSSCCSVVLAGGTRMYVARHATYVEPMHRLLKYVGSYVDESIHQC